jgi:hypothetical protein
MYTLLIPFLIWKCIDVVTSIVAAHFIHYKGFFSYGKDMLQYGMPDFVRALTNFDGIFYIRIALHGYSTTEQAYFPMYPLFIKYTNLLFQNPIISGVFISNAAFIVGLIVFYKYLQLTVKNPRTRTWIIIFLLSYPTAYYFGVMYTESLFFVLFITSLYFLKTKRFIPAFIFAFMTALTRVVGMFLIIPLACVLLQIVMKNKKNNFRKIVRENWKYILVILAPLLGFSSYCIYLWVTTGDPLYFFHAQESFGAHRSSHLIIPIQVLYRYSKIFTTADKNFQYFVSLLEIIFYIFSVLVLSYDLKKIVKTKKIDFDRLGLNIFSFINILLPSLTGTLTAIPRYTLLSISILFVLAEIENKVLKHLLVLTFGILQIVLFSLFVQGYYVT